MPLYQDFPQGVLTPGFLDGAGRQKAPISDSLMSQGALAMPQDNMAAPVTQPEVKGKRPGLLGRIKQQPGGSRALLALGASLLSNQNFFEGLGQGVMAYQDTLDAEKQRRAPQLTKDANFTYTIDPETGEVVFKRTAAADFAEAQNTAKLQATLGGIKIREEGDTVRQDKLLGYRDTWDQRSWDFRREELEQEDSLNRRDNSTDIEIARINGKNSWREAVDRQGLPGSKPPPAAIQKQIGEYTSTRDAQENAAASIAPVLDAIKRKELQFGLVRNLKNKGALATGIGGDAETIWYSQFETSLESLRNALLVANKGVQTDGDAERAMAELLSGRGDTAAVQNNLELVMASIQRRSGQAQARIDELARQYGADVGNSSPGGSTPAAPAASRSTGSTNGVRWRIVN